MSKPTPPPWFICTHDAHRFDVGWWVDHRIASENPDQHDHDHIADVTIIAPGQEGDSEANARYLATAPELVAALENLSVGVELCFCCCERGDDPHTPECQQARAALAKARGEPIPTLCHYCGAPTDPETDEMACGGLNDEGQYQTWLAHISCGLLGVPPDKAKGEA